MLLLALLGCPGNTMETGCASPSVHILEPAPDAVVCGTPLVVELEICGIELVDPYTGGEAPGTGHVDITLNGQDISMIGGEHTEVPDVTPGDYQLKVELSNADHTPIEPYAGEFLYITVDPSAC